LASAARETSLLSSTPGPTTRSSRWEPSPSAPGRRVYPFGVGGGGPPSSGFNRWSAQSQLLPYLEQAALFNALNFVGTPWLNLNPVFGPMNQTAITTKIAGFLCPADVDRIDDPLNTAHNSYRACAVSVQLVKTSINAIVWTALGTTAGGEVVDANAY
jgi:Protein of unknown function (DUF1559)